MYRCVLLAYDGSLEGRTALREGALLARRMGAEIHLLSVIAEAAGARIAEGTHAGGMAAWRDRHDAIFQEAVERLKRHGYAANARQATGEPAQEIAAYAREIGADLVVVGHRRQSLFARWWSGASGAYLSDHLECSLLIGRADISLEAYERELEAIDHTLPA